MNGARVIGAAFRRLQRRRAERAQTQRRASYHAVLNGRELSSAESEHLFRVLLFAGEAPLGADREARA